MKEELKENQDFITFSGEYQGTTNVRVLKLLYSVKRNKFIAPFKVHGDRAAGDVEYRVFPGTYLVLSLWQHRGSNEMRISLLKITKESTNVVKSVNLYFVSDSYVDNSVVAFDFVQALPGYHFTRHESLFKKIYTEQDTAILMKFLDEYDGKEFSEEAEME